LTYVWVTKIGKVTLYTLRFDQVMFFANPWPPIHDLKREAYTALMTVISSNVTFEILALFVWSWPSDPMDIP